jgi:integrase
LRLSAEGTPLSSPTILPVACLVIAGSLDNLIDKSRYRVRLGKIFLSKIESGLPPSPSTQRITNRIVAGLLSNQMIWDAVVVGFGVRRQAGPATYILRYRTKDGRQRTYTIGRHGSPWSPEAARTEALRLLGEIVTGGDPSGDRQTQRASASINVSELCDRYLADAQAGRLMTRRRVAKAPSTISTDRSRIEAHIRPVLGPIPVSALTRDDVERLLQRVQDGGTRKRVKLNKKHALSNVRGGRGAASRTVGLLGAIITFSIRLGLRTDNPVRGIVRPADGRRDRRLNDGEYRALSVALDAAEAIEGRTTAIAVIRFLTTTGWRRGEALGLRWTEIDLARSTARLRQTKTGTSTRALSNSACTIIDSMARGDYVFRSMSADAPMAGFVRVWKRVVYLGAGLSLDGKRSAFP